MIFFSCGFGPYSFTLGWRHGQCAPTPRRILDRSRSDKSRSGRAVYLAVEVRDSDGITGTGREVPSFSYRHNMKHNAQKNLTNITSALVSTPSCTILPSFPRTPMPEAKWRSQPSQFHPLAYSRPKLATVPRARRNLASV